MAPPATVLVVPCYNEAARLDERAFLAWATAAPPHLSLLFVDDGSTDDTQRVLQRLAAAAPGRVRTLALTPNGGKAEAVRRGMLQACASAARVGYWDADLATPLEALSDFEAVLDAPGCQHEMVFGARGGLLGRGHGAGEALRGFFFFFFFFFGAGEEGDLRERSSFFVFFVRARRL
jgi:glycosyltransferase involved in cell wall biosynthesis